MAGVSCAMAAQLPSELPEGSVGAAALYCVCSYPTTVPSRHAVMGLADMCLGRAPCSALRLPTSQQAHRCVHVVRHVLMQRAAVGLQLGGPLLKRLEQKVALLVAVPVGRAQVAVSSV